MMTPDRASVGVVPADSLKMTSRRAQSVLRMGACVGKWQTEMNSVNESCGVMQAIPPGDSRKLLRIASLAEQLNSDQVRKDALAAAERITDGLFYVACIGQFKRGKSTLLNALIGEPVLPSGIVPVTAIPTVVRFGERREARVRVRDGGWMGIELADIGRYVSENGNPENAMAVAGIEVLLPSPLLAGGMCLVDTPGVGSVFAGNTAAAHAFLPHIDAAIVVLGTDPPIAGDELALIEEITREILDVLFVLNKADRFTQQERAEAASFTMTVLETRLQRRATTIFQISARDRLEGREETDDWTALVRSLQKLQLQSGSRMAQESARRAERRLSRQLLTMVEEEKGALTRSVAESERRTTRLREIAAQAERSLADLGFLLAGEQERISETFGRRRDSFHKSVRASAHDELDAGLRSAPRTSGPRYRRAALQAAQSVARSCLRPWLRGEQENAEEAYGQITERFTSLANDFLARAHALARSEFSGLPDELSLESGLHARSGFRFYEFTEVALPASPLRYIADVILGVVGGHSVIAADAHEFLDRLLETNSERVKNDLLNRVTESRTQLETELRSVLCGLGAAAERGLARARAAHAKGQAAVSASLQMLSNIESELLELARDKDFCRWNS